MHMKRRKQDKKKRTFAFFGERAARGRGRGIFERFAVCVSLEGNRIRFPIVSILC